MMTLMDQCEDMTVASLNYDEDNAERAGPGYNEICYLFLGFV